MQKEYVSPYIIGVGIGILLLATFFIMGRGLGASGAMMRTVVAVEKTISPEHTANNVYLQRYGGGKDGHPFQAWLVFEVAGIMVGALASGLLAGRARVETCKSQQISDRKRLALAFLGGGFFGVGTRFARGCTSGQALTGCSTLVPGSWIVLFCLFAAAYGTAYFVRKQWL